MGGEEMRNMVMETKQKNTGKTYSEDMLLRNLGPGIHIRNHKPSNIQYKHSVFGMLKKANKGSQSLICPAPLLLIFLL